MSTTDLVDDRGVHCTLLLQYGTTINKGGSNSGDRRNVPNMEGRTESAIAIVQGNIANCIDFNSKFDTCNIYSYDGPVRVC